ALIAAGREGQRAMTRARSGKNALCGAMSAEAPAPLSGILRVVRVLLGELNLGSSGVSPYATPRRLSWPFRLRDVDLRPRWGFGVATSSRTFGCVPKSSRQLAVTTSKPYNNAMSLYFPTPDERSRHNIFPGVEVATCVCDKLMLSVATFEPHAVV